MRSTRYLLMLSAALAAGFLGWAVGDGSLVRPARAATAFANASLKGTFGFTLQGPIAGPSLLSGYGVITADGNGGLTGTQNLQTVNGMMSRTFTGTYVVNEDGTGTLEMDFPPIPSGDPTVAPTLQPASHFAFVLVDGGKSLQSIQTDPGTFVNGNFVQQ